MTSKPELPAHGRIAFVDDDELFRGAVSANLSDAGYEVLQFDDGNAAFEGLQGNPDVQLVLLDWQMPGFSGLEVLQRLNDARIDVPVIFLTSYAGHVFEETAFMNGAVDFVDKTRSFAILLNRINAVIMGRKGMHAPVTVSPAREPIRCGRLELALDSATAHWGGARVALTVTEFRIVHHLVLNAGNSIAHRQIYDIVHGEGFVAGDGEHGYRTNVRTLIKRIRQKFCEVDPAFERIETYSGFGYRWLPPDAEARSAVEKPVNDDARAVRSASSVLREGRPS